jgi:two-component system, OmpR family, sensor histidine kinase BaeS
MLTSMVLVTTELAVVPVMPDEASVALFVSLTVAVSVLAALVVPLVLRRLPLRASVPALALVGPVLGIIGSLIGTGAMTLSGHDIWYALLVAGCTGAAASVVGLRLARPVARDLDQVMGTVESVAAGHRGARTAINRPDEIGKLAAAVDELSRSLSRAETERVAADEERRSVVSALSHDLRTPLASLLASVDALTDGIGEPPVHLRAMRANVLALESLVGDLFLLARADSGSLALGSEALDLAELIDEAVEAVEPVASARTVAVVARPVGPLVVIGDHQALGRVLRNLLDNAVRYSPPRGTVTVFQAARAGRAYVGVEDEGPGFDPSFAGHAFDRFTQADDARHRPGGAGLGLAIAQTLILAHQGSIRIEPGPGARVVVELPLAVSDRYQQAAAPGSGSGHPGLVQQRRELRRR